MFGSGQNTIEANNSQIRTRDILIFSLTVGCTICVGLVLAIPISMIVMGKYTFYLLMHL